MFKSSLHSYMTYYFLFSINLKCCGEICGLYTCNSCRLPYMCYLKVLYGEFVVCSKWKCSVCLYSLHCVQWSVGLILNSLIRQYNQFSATYYSIISWCRPLTPTFTFLTGFIPLVSRICGWKSDMENIRNNDDVSSIKKHSYLPVLVGVWICFWTGVDGSLFAEHILNDIRVDDIWLNSICWTV